MNFAEYVWSVGVSRVKSPTSQSRVPGRCDFLVNQCLMFRPRFHLMNYVCTTSNTAVVDTTLYSYHLYIIHKERWYIQGYIDCSACYGNYYVFTNEDIIREYLKLSPRSRLWLLSESHPRLGITSVRSLIFGYFREIIVGERDKNFLSGRWFGRLLHMEWRKKNETQILRPRLDNFKMGPFTTLINSKFSIAPLDLSFFT